MQHNEQKMEQKHRQILKQTIQKIGKIGKILKDQSLFFSFQGICYLYKNIARKLIFLMRRYKKQIKASKLIQDSLEQSLQIILQIVSSTQYTKYGHSLPFFNYIITKFQKQFTSQIKYNHQSIINRISSLQKQIYFKGINNHIITDKELSYIQMQYFNSDLRQICKDLIKLHNPQCICCSTIFVKGQPIINLNPLYSVVVGLNQKDNFQLNFERYLCAVCNQGGGVIILGAQIRDNVLWSNGIKFKDVTQIQQKQKQIYRAISFIHPNFYYSVSKLVVQSNFIQKDAISDQFMRFCYRICVLPIHADKKYYVEIYNKGFHTLFQAYRLVEQNRIQKIQAKSTNDTFSTFYTTIHTHFYKTIKMKKSGKSTLKSNHFPIQCAKPLMQYSKQFHQYIQNNQININSTTQIDHTQEDEPIFKYSYTSILIVGSKNKDKYIKQMANIMKQKKMLFLLQKSFQNSFKEGARSIWILSHYDRHDIIKSILKNCDSMGHITLTPIFKTLQIDKHKLPPQKQSVIEKKFKNRYPEGYFRQQLQKVEQYEDEKLVISLQFNSFSHAIYAYLIFQSLQLIPYFVKDNTIYQKKLKKLD